MNPASLREKLRYKFDNWMSRGVLALIGLLSVAALVAILFVSAVVAILRIQPEGEEIDFGEAVWADESGHWGQRTAKAGDVVRLAQVARASCP